MVSLFRGRLETMKKTCEWIVCHHSVTPTGQDDNKSEASFNANHKGRGFPQSKNGWYIGYHKVIYSSGEIRTYRDDDEVGAHCKEATMNYKSIGICLEGNFDDEKPTVEQCKSLLAVISELQGKYHIPDNKVVPHRYFATGKEKNTTSWKTFSGMKPYKSCWGALLPDNIIEYLKPFGPMPTELPAVTAHYAADEEAFFTKLYGVSKKNLDEPMTRGEAYVLLKHLYDDRAPKVS